MNDKSSSPKAKLPIHFYWANRLLMLVFFSMYLFASIFPGELKLSLLLGVVGYGLLAFAISLTALSQKRISKALVLLIDSALLGFLAAYNGLDVSTLAIILAVSVVWITSGTVIPLIYPLILFLGGLVFSYYYSQVIDFSVWGFEQQISIALTLMLAISGLYQTYKELNSTKSQLVRLQKNQAGLKLKNYQIAKYLPAPLRERIYRSKEVAVSTSRKKLTVFFSDLVGFSQMSEEMEPNELSHILDSYLSEMADIADEHGATVDKFIGDGIMIFFGDPKTKGTKEDAEICVAMALDMQRRMNLLQIKWRQEGIDRNLQVRMGVNTGFCTVGNFGSNDRMNYTAVGTEVNLASRLETACTPGEVLISSSTYILIQEKFVCKNSGDVQVKGFAEPVPVFTALGSRKDLDKATDYLNYSSAGFSINIDTDAIPNYDRKKVLEALQTVNDLVQRNFRKQ